MGGVGTPPGGGLVVNEEKRFSRGQLSKIFFERLAVIRGEVGDVFLCDRLGKGLLGL